MATQMPVTWEYPRLNVIEQTQRCGEEVPQSRRELERNLLHALSFTRTYERAQALGLRVLLIEFSRCLYGSGTIWIQFLPCTEGFSICVL
ncbi:hypothetical protein EUGRSUZ_B03611 [Eucalyptus grandis]|uniref:Uncharacterized protein n=2 Tax=Eucalyptus grandis TaxID=71139 RepID=A0ACC3LWW1_EUCGR|nr:hypothetical protein EUGRSUZ_B03611 [Eucalyptus grandis]